MDTQKVSKGVEEVKKAAEETQKAVSETGKKGINDYLQLTDIFSDFLPRSFRQVTRGFQGTQRAVQRTSRSFAVLRSSLAALGIPLLITAITLLIDNLETVTDWLGITSQANRDAKAAQEAHTAAVREAYNETSSYIDILSDESQSLEVRQYALDRLKTSLDGIADVELMHADAIERVMAANERNARVEGLRAEIAERQRQLEEQQTAALEAKEKWHDWSFGAMQKEMIQTQRYNNYVKENVIPLQNELNELKKSEAEITIEIQKELAAEAKAREEAAQKKREEEDAARALLKQKEQLAALEQRLSSEEYLASILDEHERNLARIEMEREAELQAAEDLGASRDVMLMIEEKFLRQKNEVISAYEEQVERDENQARERREQETERARSAEYQEMTKYYQQLDRLEKEMRPDPVDLAEQRQREEDDLAESYAAKLELAEGNADLTLMIQAKLREDMLKIDQKYNNLELEEQRKQERQMQEAREMRARGVEDLFSAIGSLFERGSEAAKTYAVIEVLLNQAKALSSAIAGAAQASAAGGPAAPFLLVGYISSMVASVIGGFASIKNILSEADAASGSIGQTRGSVASATPQALVPQNVQATTQGNFRAFVVQSELQGFQNFQSDVSKRITL